MATKNLATASSKKLYLIFALSFGAGILIAVALYFWFQKNPQTSKIQDSDWAIAVLTEKDIAEVTDTKGDIRSQPIEFNDHMEPEEASAPYKSVVGRGTMDRNTGLIFVSNAIVSFNSREEAQNFMTTKSNGKTKLTPKKQYGEASAVYFQEADEIDPASVTYRLTQATVAMKIQVFDRPNRLDEGTNSVTMATAAEEKLLSLAEKLAAKQLEKTKRVLNGFERFSNEPQNVAMRKLPKTIAGATYIGTAKVEGSDWLGITRDFEHNTFEGFQSGGLTRFHHTTRPKEAVEVVVLEFKTPEQAAAYQNNFLNTGVAVDETIDISEIELPESIDAFAGGLLQETLAEIQAVKGRFIVDISILSPFDVIDKEAAVSDLTKIAETVLSEFSEK